MTRDNTPSSPGKDCGRCAQAEEDLMASLELGQQLVVRIKDLEGRLEEADGTIDELYSDLAEESATVRSLVAERGESDRVVSQLRVKSTKLEAEVGRLDGLVAMLRREAEARDDHHSKNVLHEAENRGKRDAETHVTEEALAGEEDGNYDAGAMSAAHYDQTAEEVVRRRLRARNVVYVTRGVTCSTGCGAFGMSAQSSPGLGPASHQSTEMEDDLSATTREVFGADRFKAVHSSGIFDASVPQDVLRQRGVGGRVSPVPALKLGNGSALRAAQRGSLVLDTPVDPNSQATPRFAMPDNLTHLMDDPNALGQTLRGLTEGLSRANTMSSARYASCRGSINVTGGELGEFASSIRRLPHSKRGSAMVVGGGPVNGNLPVSCGGASFGECVSSNGSGQLNNNSDLSVGGTTNQLTPRMFAQSIRQTPQRHRVDADDDSVAGAPLDATPTTRTNTGRSTARPVDNDQSRLGETMQYPSGVVGEQPTSAAARSAPSFDLPSPQAVLSNTTATVTGLFVSATTAASDTALHLARSSVNGSRLVAAKLQSAGVPVKPHQVPLVVPAAALSVLQWMFLRHSVQIPSECEHGTMVFDTPFSALEVLRVAF